MQLDATKSYILVKQSFGKYTTFQTVHPCHPLKQQQTRINTSQVVFYIHGYKEIEEILKKTLPRFSLHLLFGITDTIV